MRSGHYVRRTDGATDYPYEVIKPIRWKAAGHAGLVPVGFRCDGGSTGPAGRIGFPSVGDEMERGYIVHDYLYRFGQMKRRRADKIMRELHKQDGAHWFRRMAAWVAVRRFGRASWRKHRAIAEQ